MNEMEWPRIGDVSFEIEVPHNDILNVVSVNAVPLMIPGHVQVIIGDSISSNDIGDLNEIRDGLKSLPEADRIVVYDVINYQVPQLDVNLRHTMISSNGPTSEDLVVATQSGLPTSVILLVRLV